MNVITNQMLFVLGGDRGGTPSTGQLARWQVPS
jgi:hypothetical protein